MAESVDRFVAPLFSASGIRCSEMDARDIPRLQRFIEENPEYDLTVSGAAPGPGAASEVFQSVPPAGWPYGKKWVLAFDADDGSMVAMADLLSNLFSEGVWHIGLFIVATRLHGSGSAQDIYRALEMWMRERGARWSRLGVVVGNARAERFWERCGYVEVRRRLGIPMGIRTNDVRVMVKALAGGSMQDYFLRVERDQPDAP